VVSRMSEEGLKSLAENEGKTVDAAQNCKNNSVPVAEHVREAAEGRGVYKVVHSLMKQTVEFIIDDGRNVNTVEKKMIAELEETRLQIENAKKNAKKMEAQRIEDSRRHATEMKKMEAQQIEDSRRHAKEMEAKENQKRAEIKKWNARVEKEKNEKLQALAEVKQLKQQALRDQSARAVAATESKRVEKSKATKAMDALMKAREGSEELRTQLGAAKNQLKNEKAKRENVDKVYKNTKQALATALKEHDEHRVIQEGIVENQEGEIARLTKVMEDIAMEEEIRRRIVVESVMTQTDSGSVANVTEGVHAVSNDEGEQQVGKGECVQVVASLRDDRGKASKMETNKQPEEQNSAVADAKCADGETETEEDQRVVADDEAEVVGSQILKGEAWASYEKWKKDNPILWP